MSRQPLKDARFHTIGFIDTATDGKQTARDAAYHTVGYYDPRTNLTKDKRFHTVGSGNLLSALVPRR